MLPCQISPQNFSNLHNHPKGALLRKIEYFRAHPDSLCSWSLKAAVVNCARSYHSDAELSCDASTEQFAFQKFTRVDILSPLLGFHLAKRSSLGDFAKSNDLFSE